MFDLRILLLASSALVFPAYALPPALDPQIAELCRAHFNNVLVFEWEGDRRVLPVDSGMTRDEDAEWRARLALPAHSRSPDPAFNKLSHPLSAVERLGDGWLVGTNLGEWGGGLFFVREGRPPQQLVRGNVHALVVTPGGVYALFGLAHLGGDEGHYRLISYFDEVAGVGEQRPLPGSPIEIARDDSATYVAGGFGRDGERTWARVFGHGEPVFATVSAACP